MKLVDPLFGTHDIAEPLLLDLLNSAAMQRLKRIAQFGVPDKYFLQPGFSRYEHSVGVMLLLRRLGADTTEQAAGLLHDVSHTAFSHVIDWVLGDPSKENYQDERHLEVLEQPELVTILRKHNLVPNDVADYHHYPLLEREAPDLCADRVDYTLREVYHNENHAAVKICIDSLTVFDNKMVFASLEGARQFGQLYVDRQRFQWGSVNSRLRYKLFADVLQLALESKIITVEDFFADDAQVMRKIDAADDVKINAILEPMTLAFAEEHLEQGKALNLQKKIRFVDPEFIANGQLQRLSVADDDYAHELERIKSGR